MFSSQFQNVIHFDQESHLNSVFPSLSNIPVINLSIDQRSENWGLHLSPVFNDSSSLEVDTSIILNP